ncbi:hypothetical protein PMAYCL1PPCAC_20965, partial [Pristionchus mayeri]
EASTAMLTPRRLAAGATLFAASAALAAEVAAAAASAPAAPLVAHEERTCPAPGGLDTTIHRRVKKCPSFKDDPSKNFCCPSKIEINGFYCCTEDEMHKHESEESSRAWREFFSTYIGAIIACIAVLLCVSICVAYVICRRYCLKPRECGWYSQEGENYNSDRIFSNRAKRRRTTLREAELAAQAERNAPAYRPIEGNHKIYEAPPPYSPATNPISHSVSAHSTHHGVHHLPPPQSIVDQQRNDWNCLIENEMNDGRPTLVPSLPPPPF